ncbi:MAG: PIN domain-containing protein [Eubacterium sp.]|nr:PIN domain-containing protein [Eubacterium sp.]
MRLMIDANIILDVLQKREPHFADSAIIWKLCETNQAEGYVSALSIANLVYIMRKELNPGQVKEVLEKLKMIFNITDLKEEDLTSAANMGWTDFEDAVQSAIAVRIQADYIITRNIRDYLKSSVMAFTPSEYIARI